MIWGASAVKGSRGPVAPWEPGGTRGQHAPQPLWSSRGLRPMAFASVYGLLRLARLERLRRGSFGATDVGPNKWDQAIGQKKAK